LPHGIIFLLDWLTNWELLERVKHFAPDFPVWRHEDGTDFVWNSIKSIDKVGAKIPDTAREFVAKNRSLRGALNRVLGNSISETSDTDAEYLSSVFDDSRCSVSSNIPGRWINLMSDFKLIFAVHKGLFLIFMNPWSEIPDCSHRIKLFANDWHSYEIKRSLSEKSLAGRHFFDIRERTFRLISLIRFNYHRAY
jgi:hypothetical protein